MLGASSLARLTRCPLCPDCTQVLHRSECRDGPCVDGSGLARRIFTLQQWSEQPCVRPVCAVLMTAGHNALRGSGPGQNLAFDDAVARVGCPDRRIDRHCIKCCSPSQPLRHAGCPVRSRSRRESGRFSIAFVPGHHSPSHPGEFVGQRDGGDLGGSPRQQCGEPGPMPSAVGFGVADHAPAVKRLRK